MSLILVQAKALSAAENYMRALAEGHATAVLHSAHSEHHALVAQSIRALAI
jgi:hypothetical protein